ncbi:MAG: IPT/TIG domain-containing protein [Desulfuromonadales bacterium]|nr:IPT/TIG domain-containing protein [Desulfuromonadales bacterium]
MTKIVWAMLFAMLLTGTPVSALEITSVTPTRATPGTLVVLTGGDFSAQSRIFLGEQFVPPARWFPRQMEFIVPALPPGGYSLTVQDEIDSVLQPFNFEVLAPRPQIARIEPDNLDVCADEAERSVRVSGSNFHAEALVLLGGSAVNSRAIDASAMEIRLPEMPAGVYGVEVRNPDGAASLPHSLWINSVPEIIGVERGSEFVNHYEVIVRGKNFFYNSILMVREADAGAGGLGTRQMTYYAHRGASALATSDFAAPGEQLRYLDCTTLVYLRYPSNLQDKELTLQVINPDGKKTAPYLVTLP